MRSLLTLWLMALLLLPKGSAAGQSSHFMQNGTPIAFEGYWKLVRDTRQAISQMEAKPEGTIRQELNALASQWQQVTAVEYPDHSLVTIDSSYLVAELQRNPPELKRLGNEFDALIRAHEKYPQKVFTLEDVAPLKEILARPEFQWQQAQVLKAPDWLANLYERFINFLNRIIAAVANFIYEGWTLYKIGAALLFIFSLAWAPAWALLSPPRPRLRFCWLTRYYPSAMPPFKKSASEKWGM